MESGGSGAGNDGVSKMQQENEQMAGQGGGGCVGNIWRTDARWETARTGTTMGAWYNADGWCDRWTGRRLQFFF